MLRLDVLLIKNQKLKYLILLFFILFGTFCWSQEVIVYNAKTGVPVDGVLIFSNNFTTQTNILGEANLEYFKNTENIFFQHSSFLKHTSTKAKILKQGNTVLLIEDPVKIDEIVISVNRREQAKSEIPNTISTINIEEVIHSNPQTTADLLSTKGGIFIQKSQLGGGSPMIRGFSANRILLVIDGIRMNNAIYRSGNLHNVISLDANAIENTEIIYGPGSVIYGSDALGGVLCFNTLKPQLSTSELYKLSNHVLTRYSSANNEKTIHADFNFGKDKWATLFNVTYSDFGDLQMGSNGPGEYLQPEYVSKSKFNGSDIIIQNDNQKIQKYSRYNQINLMSKTRYRPSEFFELNVGAHFSTTSDIPRYDRLVVYSKDKLKYGNWYYGPQKWLLINTQAFYKKKTALFDQINFISGYQDYTESRFDRKLNSPDLRSRKENLKIYSINFDFDKKLDDNNMLFYGLEGYYNHVNSMGESQNLLDNTSEEVASRYPDNSNYSSIASYVTYKLNIKKTFTFQTGIRYTLTHISGNFSDKFYDFPTNNFTSNNSAVNGNLGIVWHPSKEWQINLIGSTGFRAPNIDDIAKVFDSEPGNVIVPNPDLKPEYARSIELTVMRTYINKARIEINGFYTHLKDAMVRRDFLFNGQDSILYDGEQSKVEALVNAESATIYGASLTFEYLFNNYLRTKGNITVTKGEDSDNLPLRHVPPTFGNAHLIYENQNLFIDIYSQFSGEIANKNLAKSEKEKPYMYAIDENGYPYSPSWWTLNLKSSYKVNKYLTLSGGIENLLDKRYRTYSSGIVSPGRNFIFSIMSRF